MRFRKLFALAISGPALAFAVGLGCSGSSAGDGSALKSGNGSSSSSGSGGDNGTSTGGSGGGSTTGSSSGVGSSSGTTASTSSGSGSSSGPTPPMGNTMYPFPQGREYANCTYPVYSNADVQKAYTTFKNDLVTSNGAMGFQRVERSASELNPLDTVSEGIGYGMILAVYMNDQTLFDNLWQYEQAELDNNHLMTWEIGPGGSPAGSGAATDGDEDMAWALLMADKQWGTSAKLGAYLPIAQKQISYLWASEIDQGCLVPKLGDNWGGCNGTPAGVNISYFAPAYYREFAAVDSHDWMGVVNEVYTVISANLTSSAGNATNGLVPGFSLASGGEMSGQAYTYQYDACRTPFRIGLDWCINGEPRAKQYVELTSAFFGKIGVDVMVDGYDLDGTPTGSRAASPFVGPAAVGMMVDNTHPTFLSQSYLFLTRNPQQGGQYYAESWTALSLLMLSGNFVDFRHLP